MVFASQILSSQTHYFLYLCKREKENQSQGWKTFDC